MSSLSDDELVALVRDGETAAYAELWSRHSGAAYAVARAFTTLDADDVTAEAFTRILAAIRGGGGPTMGFRAYLLTSTRNVAREWGGRHGRVDTVDLSETADIDEPEVEDTTLAAIESGTTASAFRSLPTRWQEALWYSEVEKMRPRQFAPLLGLSANAASALVIRARNGFRDAWIAKQLREAESPECRETLSLLGAHTRGALSARDARKVDAHLETCPTCPLAWEEARDVSSRLALVLLPLVVGVPATAAYAAWTQSGGASVVAALGQGGVGGGMPAGAGVSPAGSAAPSAGASATPGASASPGATGTPGGAGITGASATPRATGTPGASGPGGAATGMQAGGGSVGPGAPGTPGPGSAGAPTPPRPRPGVKSLIVGATAAAAAVVLVAGVAFALTQQSPDPPVGPPAAEAGAHTETHDDAAPPGRDEPAIDAPAPPAADPPAVDPRPMRPAPRAPVAQPPPAPVPDPSPDPVPSPDPAATPDPQPSTDPPDEEPPDEEEPPALAAPAMTVDTSAGPLVYPAISGTAEPGARVEVLDEEDHVRTWTLAEEDGSWSVDELSGGPASVDDLSPRCATDAGSYLGAGDHTLRARQVVDDVPSPLSDPASIHIAPPPVITGPADGAALPRDGSFTLSLTGAPNTLVQRIKTPDPAPCRTADMPIGADGEYHSLFDVPDDDVFTIGARYFDTATDRYGPATFVTYTTVP